MPTPFPRFDVAAFLETGGNPAAASPPRVPDPRTPGTPTEHFRNFRSFRNNAASKQKRPTAPKAPPPAWLDEIELLRQMNPPAGVQPGQWPGLLFAVDVMSAVWLTKASVLGWSVVEVFGVQSGRTYPLSVEGGLVVEAARHDADVILITDTEAMLRRRDGSGTRVVRRASLPAEMVPIWQLPTGGK